MWQTCQFDDTDLLSKLVPNRLGAAVTKLSAKLFRFGMGETGAQIAAGMPEKNFLGVEVHTPSVDSLLKQIGEQGRCNLRLIQPPLVQLLAPGGYLHCATDWEDHAQQMLALRNSAEGFAPRPGYRPVTKFENRGLRLRHGVWDLVFRKL